MSNLLNSSPTVDFEVGRDTRQGDPISPFLFLISAEGLVGMMMNVVNLGQFIGFKVASDFFACKIGTIQFFFLGLAVGSNHRRMSFLNPIVWKAPKVIVQELITIQRRFLWGGVYEIKKQSWIGLKPLAVVFPDLFREFDVAPVNIFSMGNWLGDIWLWNLEDNNNIHSVQAAEQFLELKFLLENVQPKIFGEDSFVWKLDANGFSIASSYKLIFVWNEEVFVTDTLILSGLANFWRLKVSSKIHFFWLEMFAE
ncbi:hypothetical protein KIW84_044135 [Lathyrus oleraceus]|uniref:Uncharacterized protein n=1 Tax=Pisum sativum TaxID=3888 RepID=A0A9D4XK98_PEA|nr:hypothetical protein KIW84_044135 [Pisum sativum]